MFNLPLSRLSLLLLALAAFSFTSCDDDDDTFLGIDTNDDGTLFLSSNNSGAIGVLNLEDGDMPSIDTFSAEGMDGDGLFYKSKGGDLYQVSRSNDIIVQYDDPRDGLDDKDGVEIKARSTSNFTNGRGLASYRGDRLVVAQQGSAANSDNNSFAVYNTSDDDKIDFMSTHPTNIALWGIQFIGEDLFAVVDNSDSVAIFKNFLNKPDGDSIVPTRFIKIEGITRTHGIQYNDDDDIMILTDIGEASDATDGALVVIRKFSELSDTITTVGSDSYTRIDGANTLLGNPVDVDYDKSNGQIYVADRLSQGGVLLVFKGDASGNATPLRQIQFPGLSSLYLHRD